MNEDAEQKPPVYQPNANTPRGDCRTCEHREKDGDEQPCDGCHYDRTTQKFTCYHEVGT